MALPLAPALALALALAATAAAVDDTTLVRLPGQGAVRGVQLPGSRYWYGIPFAEPPTGKNRWRAPQPRAPWAGVRESEVQPQCMQHSPGWRGASMSEDCLYLNVFAAPPNATEELRPVMVWIHGGGFNGGDAVQGHGLFNGSGLVESQGVVVVSLDYRVNAFGFLGSQHLRDADGSTGNFGMQVRWKSAHVFKLHRPLNAKPKLGGVPACRSCCYLDLVACIDTGSTGGDGVGAEVHPSVRRRQG